MLALTPNLQNLATVLRHPDMWPEGFWWDFRRPSCCGFGLSKGMWGNDDPIWNGGLNPDYMGGIFGSDLAQRLGVRMRDVQPEHVADAIDAYLAAQESATVAVEWV